MTKKLLNNRIDKLFYITNSYQMKFDKCNLNVLSFDKTATFFCLNHNYCNVVEHIAFVALHYYFDWAQISVNLNSIYSRLRHRLLILIKRVIDVK